MRYTSTLLRTAVLLNLKKFRHINLSYWTTCKLFFTNYQRYYSQKRWFQYYVVWEVKRLPILLQLYTLQPVLVPMKYTPRLGNTFTSKYLYLSFNEFLRNSISLSKQPYLLIFSLRHWVSCYKRLWFTIYYYFNFMFTLNTTFTTWVKNFTVKPVVTTLSLKMLRYL